MKEPERNMSAGTTGCSGCFWFLLSIDIKSLAVIKTPCSLPTSLPWLCLIIDYSSSFFLKCCSSEEFPWDHQLSPMGGHSLISWNSNQGSNSRAARSLWLGACCRMVAQKNCSMETAHECRNRGKCGWKRNKNVRLYTGTGQEFVFSYLRSGEKFGEEVPAAGKRHVPQSVFIEPIGVAAVCELSQTNIKNCAHFTVEWK